MYRKYVTKGGERVGPYYYESLRLPDGKVKAVYFGRKKPTVQEKEKKIRQVLLKNKKPVNVVQQHVKIKRPSKAVQQKTEVKKRVHAVLLPVPSPHPLGLHPNLFFISLILFVTLGFLFFTPDGDLNFENGIPFESLLGSATITGLSVYSGGSFTENLFVDQTFSESGVLSFSIEGITSLNSVKMSGKTNGDHNNSTLLVLLYETGTPDRLVVHSLDEGEGNEHVLESACVNTCFLTGYANGEYNLDISINGNISLVIDTLEFEFTDDDDVQSFVIGDAIKDVVEEILEPVVSVQKSSLSTLQTEILPVELQVAPYTLGKSTKEILSDGIIQTRDKNSIKNCRGEDGSSKCSLETAIMDLNYYDLDASVPAWKPIDTTIKNVGGKHVVKALNHVYVELLDNPGYKIVRKDSGEVVMEELLSMDGKILENLSYEIVGNKKIFRDVFEDTDFEVVVVPNMAKGNIILKSPKAPKEFKFRLRSSTPAHIVKKNDVRYEGLSASELFGGVTPSELLETFGTSQAIRFGRLLTSALVISSDHDKFESPPVSLDYKNDIMTVSLELANLTVKDYPIVVDPVTMPDNQVSASVADARDRGQSWPGRQYFSTTETSSALGVSGAQGFYSSRGEGFQVVPIPVGATISTSKLGFFDTNSGAGTRNFRLYVASVDNATPWANTAGNRPGDRNRTANYAFWNPTPISGWINTTDVSVPLQELIDRDDWTEGDGLAFIATSDYTGMVLAQPESYESFRTYDYSGNTFGAILYVEYTTSNTAPTTPVPIINSTDDTNFSTVDLNCFDTIIDPEGDAMNVTIEWYKDAVLNVTGEYNNSYANATFFNAVLNSTNTTAGEVWTCGMQLFDGNLYSAWANSSGLTIINLFPVVTLNNPEDGLVISMVGNTTLNSTVTDVDLEIMNVTYYGQVGGVLPSTEHVLFYNESVASSTVLVYNWTAPPINSTFFDDPLKNITLLLHLDQNELYGENSTFVVDFSGNVNGSAIPTADGVANFTKEGGKLGGGLSFAPGPLIYVDFGDRDDHQGVNISYVAWMYPFTDTVGTTVRNVYHKRINAESAGLRIGRRVNNLTYKSNNDAEINLENFFTPNEWVHMVFVIEDDPAGDNNPVKIYRNGVLWNDTTTMTSPLDNSDVSKIGAGTTSPAVSSFTGVIDEFVIVNGTLNVSDAASMYEITSGTYYWYANASDGKDINGSDIWSFTFTPPPVISNIPPVVEINGPLNTTVYNSVGNVTLNVTITDADADTMQVTFYGQAGTFPPSTEHVLLYNSSVITTTVMTYNWTAPPINRTFFEDPLKNITLLLHLDNNSLYDENQSLVVDFSGNVNGSISNVTHVNLTPTAGKLGGGLSYTDAVNVYVDFGDRDDHMGMNISYAAWLYPFVESDPDTVKNIYHKMGVGNIGFRLGRRMNNLTYKVDALSEVTFANFFTPNEWVHMVFVIEDDPAGDNNPVKIYRNGLLWNDTTTMTSPVENTELSKVGGTRLSSKSQSFSGIIDEFVIVNGTLNTSDVTNMYELTTDTYHWQVNASDGTVNNGSVTFEFTIASLPTVSAITVNPDPSNTTDQLFCQFTASSSDATLGCTVIFYNGSVTSSTVSNTYNSGVASTENHPNAGIQAKSETWTCGVNCTDTVGEGAQTNSSSIDIINSPPSIPVLVTPADNNRTINATPFFDWNAITDPDDDSINYTLNITAITSPDAYYAAGDHRVVVITDNSTNYTLIDDLDLFLDDNYRYNWTVEATDGENSSGYAIPFNVSFEVFVAITLQQSLIEFGDTAPDASKRTPADAADMQIENLGNSLINVNHSSDNFLFSTLSATSSSYQLNITDAGGQVINAYDIVRSNTTSINIDTKNQTILFAFNETTKSNISYFITVPSAEPVGIKNSTLTYLGYYGGI